MQFVFQVTVEVERESGKFVSRDSIRDEIEQAISDADPSSIDVDESTYEIYSWDVEEIPQKAGTK